MSAAERTKDRSNLLQHWEGRVLGLSSATSRKVLSDRPALKPDWGKPTVRNFREEDGKEQPTRPQSSGVQVPAPPIACLRAVSISDGRDQLTLMCSAGDRPAKAKVRSLVVWMAGWRERKFSEV